METPQTRYASSGEIKIACQVLGSGEHDLLFSGGSTSNVETVWSLRRCASSSDSLWAAIPVSARVGAQGH